MAAQVSREYENKTNTKQFVISNEGQSVSQDEVQPGNHEVHRRRGCVQEQLGAIVGKQQRNSQMNVTFFGRRIE